MKFEDMTDAEIVNLLRGAADPERSKGYKAEAALRMERLADELRATTATVAEQKAAMLVLAEAASDLAESVEAAVPGIRDNHETAVMEAWVRMHEAQLVVMALVGAPSEVMQVAEDGAIREIRGAAVADVLAHGGVRMSDAKVIAAEAVDRCQLCGVVAEVRPYGPNGEEVCFQCAMKDEAAARRQFEKHVLGNGLPRHKARRRAP